MLTAFALEFTHQHFKCAIINIPDISLYPYLSLLPINQSLIESYEGFQLQFLD